MEQLSLVYHGTLLEGRSVFCVIKVCYHKANHFGKEWLQLISECILRIQEGSYIPACPNIKKSIIFGKKKFSIK